MEQKEEMEKSCREKEEKIKEKTDKMERQLVRIYDKLLSIEVEVKEMRRQNRIKEVEKESKKLNDEKNYLENSSDHRYDRMQEEMNWFTEK